MRPRRGIGRVKTRRAQHTRNETEEQSKLAETLKVFEKCGNCSPLTPLKCVNECNVWKLKNEYRKLYETMANPTYMTKLLNALKNKRRRRILKIIWKRRYSIGELQRELKKLGYRHSQMTIVQEYVTPLIDVGVASETQGRYDVTTFGLKLNELMEGNLDSDDFESILPSYSKCYEEIILNSLLIGPKNFEDMKNFVLAKSVPRVLGRLRKAGFIEATKGRDYVFFFKSNRDSGKEKFSPTERKVYESVSVDGISAKELAEKSRISLRRTYRYIRRLKGKRLVFARKRMKSYVLTSEGLRVATGLEKLSDLVLETSMVASQVVKSKDAHRLLVPPVLKVPIEE